MRTATMTNSAVSRAFAGLPRPQHGMQGLATADAELLQPAGEGNRYFA